MEDDYYVSQEIINKLARKEILETFIINCAVCNKRGEKRSEIVEHHLDYYKEKTIWLCKSCHKQWHRNNKTIGTRKEMFLLKKIKKGRLRGEKWLECSDWYYKLLEEGKI